MTRPRMTKLEFYAALEEIWGPQIRPKQKLITDRGKVVRNIRVQVSPDDFNYREADGGIVEVSEVD